MMPVRNVTAITQEKQFSPTMIGEDTELVFLDKWSENTLHIKNTDKQGTFDITNDLPNIGSEHKNVMRRVEVFKTQSLPSTLPNVK